MADAPNKTELRVAVDAAYLRELQDRLGVTSGTELARAALSLLDWASREVADGRIILSTDENGRNPHRLVMPQLQAMELITKAGGPVQKMRS